MEKEIYYTSNSKIYSNQLHTIEFNIISELPKIKFDKKNQIDTNKKIITELEKIIQNKNKIQIRGIIKNSKSIILKIEKIYNKKDSTQTNKKIKKPSEDNYDFISAINSNEIIKQINSQIKDNKKFDILKKQINIFTKDNHKDTDKQTKSMIEKVTKQKNKIEENNLKLKQFQTEKINPIEHILTKCDEKLIHFNLEKDTIKNEISNKKSNNKYDTKEKLKSQIEVLEDKIETNENKINQIQEHNKILKEKIKLGVVKEINPILFILTLGLSYYRKSNTLKYKIAKQLIKISNLKERNLKINIILTERQRFYKKLDKEHQINLSKIKEINKTIEEIENIKQKEELKLENIKPKEITLKEKIETEQTKLNQINEEKVNNDKTSTTEIDKLIKKIENIFQKQKEEIETIKNNLENQNINITEELEIQP
jgi:hypothetical protein